MPKSTPQWDGDAFVTRVQKHDWQLPFPYLGSPMSFSLPGNTPGQNQTKATVAFSLRLSAPKLYAWLPEPLNNKELNNTNTFDYRICTQISSHLFPTEEQNEGLDVQTVSYKRFQTLKRLIAYELNYIDLKLPNDLNASLNQDFFLGHLQPDRWTVLDAVPYIQSINHPLFSLKWCSPVEHSDSISHTHPPDSKDNAWYDTTSFHMAVTNLDNTETFAERSGIRFSLQKKQAFVFDDAVQADCDIEPNTRSYREFEQQFRSKIQPMEDDEWFCVRVKLEPPKKGLDSEFDNE
ncbi:hypothetical protein [Endozoicomonas ascidiicola]|uniref:hypothetical protein n=1 Tax=Endozoicomonas ascidiicola TaxID=1698521 RepID=UPI001FE14E84|nr:hypothetical protein [Endozoicomonas ascidiicola]